MADRSSLSYPVVEWRRRKTPANHYLLFHKPYGVLPQFTDTHTPPRPTLKDYISLPAVYPVGRLDMDSEGLMLLTNDGKLQHRLLDPRYAHPRTYLVQVERIPDPSALAELAKGVKIGDYITRPCQVRLLERDPQLPERHPPIRYRVNVPTAWLELTLTEGKNRQVRRMTAAVGFPTLRLVRVAIANLQLADLPQGASRPLTPQELQTLKQLVRYG